MLVCSVCGQSNPTDARFCMSCASPLPGSGPAPHGARKTVTVVFCDVAGSTPLAERLDPESMREVMSRFFGGMRTVLEAHGGTVEKFIGDAVMAVFGAPLLHEDDALRAVRAAAGMRDALAELNAELDARLGVELRIRIGVNTGEVVVGDPAAGQALVVGDAVILAARLEQVASPGEVLLGPQTFSLLRDHVRAEATEPLELKGKRTPIVAYRLIEVETGPLDVGTRSDPPLVDRQAELTAIGSAFRRCEQLRGCVLLTILGSAGVGKSRLSREFETGVDARSLVLRARCLPYGDAITFWPVADLVKQACAITNDDSREAATAKIDTALLGADDAELIAERVAGLIGFSPATPGLQETFWAIRRFLEWLGRDRPVVLVIDDLQWAEPTFLDLVEYLVGWCRDVALLMLVLARPDLMDARPTWGGGAANAMSLPLGPLRDDESAELIAGLLGGALLDERATDRITESAGGNPLFLEEMLRMLEDDGLLRGDEAGWVGTRDLSDVAVPASIHALLGARLDRLTQAERDVIRCASVVGKVFWWGAVAELAPESVRPYVGGHLQTLVRKDLIRPEHSSFSGEDAFRFHHILIQEAAYRGTPKEIRADLHERFADWLERTAGQRVTEYEEVVGYHLEAAHRYRAELGVPDDVDLAVRAARRLAAAGRRAFARGDMSAATDLLSRAASLLPKAHSERMAMLPVLGQALAEAGDLAGAKPVLAEAVELAEAAGDHGLRAHAVILGVLFWEYPQDRVRAMAEVEELMRVFADLGDDLGLARAHRALGDIHWTHSRFAAADESFQLALHQARRARSVSEEMEALGGTLGASVFGPTPAHDVARRCEEAAAELKAMGTVEARVLRALATVRAMEGRFDEARELATRARSMLEELGVRLRAAFISETLGFIETLAGDHAAAEREFRVGYANAIELGDRGFQSTVAAELAHALVAQGKLDEAEAFTKESEETGAEDDLATQVMWRTAQARILAARERAPEAELLAREGVTLAEETDDLNMRGDTFVDLGEVLRIAGGEKGAADAFGRALQLYDAKGNLVGAQDARGRLASLDAPV
jgi:class 3 adenylate cyclase/tetratricopeptide (TPR) repeat protein